MVKSYERQQDNVGDIYRFCNDAHKWNTISKFISFSVIVLFLIKEISHYLHNRSYIKIQANILYNIIILLLNIWILIFLKCDKISTRTRGVHILCDKVCQALATGQWFSPDPPVSFTNKTDRHNTTEILLKTPSNKQTKIIVIIIHCS